MNKYYLEILATITNIVLKLIIHIISVNTRRSNVFQYNFYYEMSLLFICGTKGRFTLDVSFASTTCHTRILQYIFYHPWKHSVNRVKICAAISFLIENTGFLFLNNRNVFVNGPCTHLLRPQNASMWTVLKEATLRWHTERMRSDNPDIRHGRTSKWKWGKWTRLENETGRE